jgi:hypothetical protein
MDDGKRGGPLPPIGALLDRPLEMKGVTNSQSHWQKVISSSRNMLTYKIIQLSYRFYHLACNAQLGGISPEVFDELKRISFTLSYDLQSIEQTTKGQYSRESREVIPLLPATTVSPIVEQRQETKHPGNTDIPAQKRVKINYNRPNPTEETRTSAK